MQYLDWLAMQLNVSHFHQWNGISSNIVKNKYGGSRFLNKYYHGNLKTALASLYPQHNIAFNDQHPSAPEQLIYSILKSLPSVPIEDWKVNYKHPAMLHSKSNRRMELDLFNEKLNIAIEYQGEQHYQQYRTLDAEHVTQQKYRDNEKMKSCTQHNITLIQIPYWWNGSKEDLMATIAKQTQLIKQ